MKRLENFPEAQEPESLAYSAVNDSKGGGKQGLNTSTCIHVHTFRKIKKQRQETGEAAQQLSSRGPSSVIYTYIWWLTNSENINARELDTCLSSSGTHTQAEYTHTSTHT